VEFGSEFVSEGGECYVWGVAGCECDDPSLLEEFE
jgi:hypothetical protein